MTDIREVHRTGRGRGRRRTPSCRATPPRAGFTLVEVLVALVILSLGILSVVALGASGPTMVGLAERRTERTVEVSAHLERAVFQLRRDRALADSSWTLPTGDQLRRTTARTDEGLWTVTLHLEPGPASQQGQSFSLSANVFLPVMVAENDPCGSDGSLCRPPDGACPVMGPLAGINLGNLPHYLHVFTDGRLDANWQSASKGFAGDVAVKGTLAKERTSGSFGFAGTIYTDDASLSSWQNIVGQKGNAGQAFAALNATSRISGLEANLAAAFAQINALPATAGFASVSSTSLNGLNRQNGIAERIVINVTSGFGVSTKINITGDASDVFILRWDTDANPANGYQGSVKFESGGAFVPLGGLTPGNFIHVAGDINSSGGGANPAPPYPQGPRKNNGLGDLINGASNFSGGGFFTGYWLTTGDPSKWETSPHSNGIFVGGWYSSTRKFSMTGGTSGVHVCPNPAAIRATP
jgi:prepilin-type N-terminal cleavage/methylation domain-containing protein